MILGIETSSPVFSLALADENQVVYEVRKDRRVYGPSRDAGLFEDLRDILAKYGPNQIQAVAVSIGPGLFTSLRVGLSLVKGLAISWEKPVIAVNTLDVLGTASNIIAGSLMAVIDARHNELYAASYDAGRRTSDYQLITPEELIRRMNGRWTAVGSGVDLLFKYQPDKTAIDYAGVELSLPSAVKVIELARPRVVRQHYEKIEELEPFYLKRTDAERNRNKAHEV